MADEQAQNDHVLDETEFENLLFEARSKARSRSPGTPDPLILAALEADPRFLESFEPLASGGMGFVFRTRFGEAARDVAVKIPLQKQDGARRDQFSRLSFWRECFAQSSLNHPGIVPLYEFGSCDDEELQPYLVMPYVPADTWRTYVGEARQTLSHSAYQSEVLRLLVRLLKIVEYAHEQGVIHRDLKPENLKVRPDGHVYVMDWGLAQGPFDDTFRTSSFAQRADTALIDEVLTPAPGQGTKWYLAPEQARDGASDERSDVFSCGRLLMHAFGVAESEYPSHPDGPDSERYRRGLRSMPKTVRAVAERACAIDPEQRYSSVRQLREELERVLTGYVAKAQRASFWTQSIAWWRRTHPVSTVAAAAALLILWVRLDANSELEAATSQQARLIVAATEDIESLKERVSPEKLLPLLRTLVEACPDDEVNARVELLSAAADLELQDGRRDRAREIRQLLIPLRQRMKHNGNEVERVRDQALALILLGDVSPPTECWSLYQRAHGMLLRCLDRNPDAAGLRDDLIWSYIRLSNPRRWQEGFEVPVSTEEEAIDRLEVAAELARLGHEQSKDEVKTLHSLLMVKVRLGDADHERRPQLLTETIGHLLRFFRMTGLTQTHMVNAAHAWRRVARWSYELGHATTTLDTIRQSLPMLRRHLYETESESARMVLVGALVQEAELRQELGLEPDPKLTEELEDLGHLYRKLDAVEPEAESPIGTDDESK